MKRILATGGFALAVAFSGPALAADMPVKAPVAPVLPAYSWTGFYVGATVGGSWGRMDSDYTNGGIAIGSASQSVNGVIGGLQAGYNWQAGSWLFGLEADIQASGQKGQTPFVDVPIIVTVSDLNTVRMPWFGTLRGRIGVTPMDRWLVYVTGGLAFADIQETHAYTVTCNICLNPTAGGLSTSATRTGWTIGAGAEVAIWDRWSAKVEYLHMDFGSFSDTASITVPAIGGVVVVGSTNRLTDNVARIGLNYRFH